jgi:hypothetical protein
MVLFQEEEEKRKEWKGRAIEWDFFDSKKNILAQHPGSSSLTLHSIYYSCTFM